MPFQTLIDYEGIMSDTLARICDDKREHIARFAGEGEGTCPGGDHPPGSRGLGHPPRRLEVDYLAQRNP